MNGNGSVDWLFISCGQAGHSLMALAVRWWSGERKEGCLASMIVYLSSTYLVFAVPCMML